MKNKKIRQPGSRTAPDSMASLPKAVTDCPGWHDRVRLFSYGLLKGESKRATMAHLLKCSACRLFLLSCLESQKVLESETARKNSPAPVSITYKKKPLLGTPARQQDDFSALLWALGDASEAEVRARLRFKDPAQDTPPAAPARKKHHSR